MVEFHRFFGFVGTLREAFKIFSKNGKPMALLILLIIFLSSLIYLSIFIFIRPLVIDIFFKLNLILASSSLENPAFFFLLNGVRKTIGDLIRVEWILIIISNIFSLIHSIATIIASSGTHNNNNEDTLSFKGILLSTLKSLKKPLITWFYITIFVDGYILLVLEIFLPPLLILANPFFIEVLSVMFVVLAVLFYNYISVVLNLALVISVVEEENYGIEALGKAAKIVKGMRLHGFLMNLVFMILSFLLVYGMNFLLMNSSSMLPTIIGWIVAISIWMVRMFWMMAFTVFYYQCQKGRTEEFELKGRIEYENLDNIPAPLLDEDTP